jgi:hypothetical protein
LVVERRPTLVPGGLRAPAWPPWLGQGWLQERARRREWENSRQRRHRARELAWLLAALPERSRELARSRELSLPPEWVKQKPT